MLKKEFVTMNTVLSVIVVAMKMKQSVSGAPKILIRVAKDHTRQIKAMEKNTKITMTTMTTKIILSVSGSE